MSRSPALSAACVLFASSCAAGDAPEAATTRGVLPAPTDTLGAAPPPGATVLLGRSGDLSKWRHEKAPKEPLRWPFTGGVLTVEPGSGSIVTKEDLADFRLHLEFKTGKGADGNSGIYIQRRYELQILDRDADAKPKHRAGSIYATRAPDADAARAAGEWQSYDIVFRAPRWDGDEKTQDARITAHLNGVMIHDDVPVPDKTGAGREEAPDPQPLKLQDHDAAVQFRNIWLVPLDLD